MLPQKVEDEGTDHFVEAFDEESEQPKRLVDLRLEFGEKAKRLIAESVRLRADIEQRWREDQEQYHGEQEGSTASSGTEDKNRARVVVNLTRMITNVSEAQLHDLLLPTDDKPWGISSSPVPELLRGAGEDVAKDASTGQTLVDPGTGQPYTRQQVAEKQRAYAMDAARGMERLIDDQLTQSDFTGSARKMLHEAAVLGTGVLQGPVVLPSNSATPQPGVRFWSAWDVFPDMAATTVEDQEYVALRSFMSARQIRKWAREDEGVDKDAVMAVLEGEPGSLRISAAFSNEKQTAGSVNAAAQNVFRDTRYEVFELHFEADADDLAAAGVELSENEQKLVSVPVIIWLCGGYVLKLVIPPADYLHFNVRFFPWEKDDNCIFGVGVPRLMRHEQRIVNTTWRMALDSAGKSGGMQVCIDEQVVRPADGKEDITRDKLWIKDSPNTPMQNAFLAFQPQSRVDDIMAIYNLARQFVSDVSGLPHLEQGVAQNPMQGSGGAMGMGAMSIQLTRSTAARRRQAKNFDDMIVKPIVTGFFDFNNEFSQDETIKGDMRVVVRAASVLLVKEFQQQGLMQMMMFAQHPTFAPMFKWDEMARQLMRSFQLPPEQFVYSQDDLRAMQASTSGQVAEEGQGAPSGMTPEELAIKQQELALKERDQQIDMMRLDMQAQVNNQDREIQIAKLDLKSEETNAQIAARIQEVQLSEASQNYRFNREMDIKERTGEGI